MMQQVYLKSLQQETYSPEMFIERIAQKVLKSSCTKESNDTSDTSDSETMEEMFTQSVRDFAVLLDGQRNKCNMLKQICQQEETNYHMDLSKQQEGNKQCMNMFYQLDEKINSIAIKVTHLGGQLETVNIPRMRTVQAYNLMSCLSSMLSLSNTNSLVNQYNLPDTPDVIRKLYSIAQELPSPRFEEAKKKIEWKYDQTERYLIEEFVEAQRCCCVQKMNEIANTLVHFKGYCQCIDAFIEESQLNTLNSQDFIDDIVPLCEKNFAIISKVFKNADQVNAKFVLNIYHLKIQKYVHTQLSDSTDSENYLKRLAYLYTKVNDLSIKLSNYNLGNDKTYLDKLTENIFHKHLEKYIGVELKNLKDKCSRSLQQYYQIKGHQKKQLQGTSFQELRRDIQAVIGSKSTINANANANVEQIDEYVGETFVCQQVSMLILNESREAFNRCHLLRWANNLEYNTMQILEVLLQYLITEYVDYAINFAIQTAGFTGFTGFTEQAQIHFIHFLQVVQQTNYTICSFEQQFTQCIVPMLGYRAKLGDCVSRKKCILEQTEMKLDAGLEKTLNGITSFIKNFLQVEQKRTDFKPEEDVDTVASPACKSVVQVMRKLINRVKQLLDGKNRENLLLEMGVRLHRVIYDHLLQYNYNSAGALCAICDVNEYRRCVSDINSSLVNTLFDTLHALCNLLLVKPENLEQVCSGDTLVLLEHSILLNFIQLRSDYKTQKLSICVKGLMT